MYKELMSKRLYDKIIDGLEPEKAITFDAYTHLLGKLSRGEHPWPNPRRIEICKTFSQKRRIVYSYPIEEMFVLRAVNHYLCKKYRSAIALSYFPSRQRTPAQCLSYILKRRDIFIESIPEDNNLYGMHMDISDYFNSMDTNILFDRLPSQLKNDSDFLKLYENTILNSLCIQAGKLINVDRKGAMAGLPFTAFFAAVYLAQMDRCFEKAGIPYVRYSDDILFFSQDKRSLEYWSEAVEKYIEDSRLKMNQEKTEFIAPDSTWTFIGFEIDKGERDISSHQLEKLKRRFSKWARRYRKNIETGYGKDVRKMTPEKAVHTLIKNINRALFKPVRDKYCWAKWAFPTVTVTRRFKQLDAFIQEKLRFVYTGHYSRRNFRILPYEKLKSMGYYSLEQLYLLYRYRQDDFNAFLDGSGLIKD